ncbi:two-component response regulator FixJ [Erythrobacter litoralis]|uniref:Response regulator FixJ n=1 Tax=Erythrobacter litoralis TaxID=39960 RepID=A0A074MKW6_9SPHN|nr:response regulator [Erythrobacter litoralis]AOL24302.1 two-component response regulator FixJ [Erythrobacter litoralis]KEO93455.1 response regulator FixJ [Erythrobacter litoralis]
MAIERWLVHVVDDEESIRRSLDFLLSNSGYDVMRWCGSESFLKGADKMTPACALVDIRMPGMDGLELQQEMKREGFNFPVIFLTGHGDVTMAVKAMQEGAVDFLQKPVDRQNVLAAVQAAFETMRDSEERLNRKEWAKTQLGRLTSREQEVLDGLACGYPNKTIAYDLGISSRTVEVYRANVMGKLDVHSFADALRIAFAAGLGSERRWLSEHTLLAPRENN